MLGEDSASVAAGNEAKIPTRIAVHGLVGGGIQAAEGGNFADGFLSAAAAEATPLNKIGTDLSKTSVVAGRSIAAGIVGGTVASATGGSFMNGAKTAAFAEMFNSVAHEMAEQTSPKITREDLTNKTPSEIRDMAEEKGLKPFGDKDNPMYPKKWKDPITNKERLRIDEVGHRSKITGEPYDNPSSAGKPHAHGYDENGTPIRNAVGDKHFPIRTIISRGAVGVFGRIMNGVGLLLYSPNAY
ncbi:MAG: hypothetical protein ABIH77_02150 [Pseudomonadota bacterium]|nr:hypothetical protein [Gammaproteobacteria bacterium]MBU1559183.1 hypothetical protein [Gammaproteobacteria bacterium]MBU1926898.1 hypothetical protein [Gammaproteobacteria bacterium]MBU2546039.1 hypothetical protein [Gammaproteobacteria bacterium]